MADPDCFEEDLDPNFQADADPTPDPPPDPDPNMFSKGEKAFSSKSSPILRVGNLLIHLLLI